MGKLTTVEQIAMLKAMTLRTGAIHEAQAHQLKMWPLLAHGIATSEARVDADAHVVKFVCTGKKFKRTKMVKRTFTAVKDWVRILLWDDAHVVFEVDGKEVYRSDCDDSETAIENGKDGGNQA